MEHDVTRGTDAELIRASLLGDEASWGLLVDRHLVRLWDTAVALGLTETQAVAALELTWLRAAQQLHLAPEAVGAWLLRLVADAAHHVATRAPVLESIDLVPSGLEALDALVALPV